jgi:hypothetical protein
MPVQIPIPRLEVAVKLIIELAIALLFGLAGYKEAIRFAQQYGRTPWGLNPWIWAVALGISFFIGCLLLVIAERQGRARATKAPNTLTAAVASPSGVGAYAPPHGDTTLPKW